MPKVRTKNADVKLGNILSTKEDLITSRMYDQSHVTIHFCDRQFLCSGRPDFSYPLGQSMCVPSASGGCLLNSLRKQSHTDL